MTSEKRERNNNVISAESDCKPELLPDLYRLRCYLAGQNSITLCLRSNRDLF